MRNIKDKIVKAIIPVVMFGFMMGFFGPVQLYINNASEFFFNFKDIIGICIVMTLVFIAVPLIVIAVVPKKASSWITTVLFGISLALYIQGNYINVNYGTLNGEKVVWSNYKSVAIWDTIIWVVCIAVPVILKFVKPKISELISKYGSLWIIAIQIVTLVVLVLGMKPKTQNNGEYIFTNEGKYTLSENENVIMFVLDCYESGDFANLLDKHTEYKDMFKNFTYYPDTVGGSTRTVLAIPNLLTGKPYTSEGKYSDYINDSFDECDTYKILDEKGYDSRIYTENTFAPSDADINIANLYNGKKEVHNYKILAEKMYQFTACQYAPHILKKYVWMYSGDFDKAALNSKVDKSCYQLDDDIFYEQLCNNKLTTIKDKAFRVYHLNGAHGPFKLKADATMSNKETSLEEQEMGVMTILNEYFEQMKKLGIYDDAKIIILADHGAYGIECNPVLLVKDGNKTSEFTVDNTPVSYENIQPTLMKMLGSEDPDGIKSIDEISSGDNKERLFYYQDKKSNKAVEYKITGALPDNAQINETGRTFKLFSADAKEYTLGTELLFNVEGTATAYVTKGLGKSEAGQTWTSGDEFEMSIPLDYNDDDELYIYFKLNKIQLPKEHVGVTINDEFLSWYLVEEETLNIRVPADMVKGKGKIKINLSLPDASFDGDERYVALLMNSVKIDKVKGTFNETRRVQDKNSN